jgi:hypothetical protein
MSKNRLLTARKPQPGNFCENTGYYVMVYSYYPGAPRILDKNKIWCVKGRKFPPYRKFVVLPNLNSNVRDTCYYIKLNGCINTKFPEI